MSEHDHRTVDSREEHEAADRFEELIRRRAFEMSQTDDAETDEENWLRAEREVRAHAGHRPVWEPTAPLEDEGREAHCA